MWSCVCTNLFYPIQKALPSQCCDGRVFGSGKMSELIVKLTATHAENSFADPDNSKDSDDTYAVPDIPGHEGVLYRTTGDHDGSNRGTITKVEVGLEHFEPTELGDSNLLAGYGSDTGLDDNVTHSLTEVVHYFNITSVRSWSWNDFNNDAQLFARWGLTDSSVDQLFFKITHTPRVCGGKPKLILPLLLGGLALPVYRRRAIADLVYRKNAEEGAIGIQTEVA